MPTGVKVKASSSTDSVPTKFSICPIGMVLILCFLLASYRLVISCSRENIGGDKVGSRRKGCELSQALVGGARSPFNICVREFLPEVVKSISDRYSANDKGPDNPLAFFMGNDPTPQTNSRYPFIPGMRQKD